MGFGNSVPKERFCRGSVVVTAVVLWIIRGFRGTLVGIQASGEISAETGPTQARASCMARVALSPWRWYSKRSLRDLGRKDCWEGPKSRIRPPCGLGLGVSGKEGGD